MSDTTATNIETEMVECPTCGQPTTVFALQANEAEFYHWRHLERGHLRRFLQVSRRYPDVVAKAYGGDIDRAAADSDEQVAATVGAWEHSQGLPPRDWHAFGAKERAYNEALGSAEPIW